VKTSSSRDVIQTGNYLSASWNSCYDDFSALMWTFFPPSSFPGGPLFRGRFLLVDLFSVNHFSVDVFSVDVISVDLFSYILPGDTVSSTW